MTLDPDPQVYRPNRTQDSSTFFTKFILRHEQDENGHDADSNDAHTNDIDDENCDVSLEDATMHQLNKALRVKEEKKEYLTTQSMQPIPLKLTNEQFPRILFLGTSAAGSFPLRSASGILVHLS